MKKSTIDPTVRRPREEPSPEVEELVPARSVTMTLRVKLRTRDHAWVDAGEGGEAERSTRGQFVAYTFAALDPLNLPDVEVDFTFRVENFRSWEATAKSVVGANATEAILSQLEGRLRGMVKSRPRKGSTYRIEIVLDAEAGAAKSVELTTDVEVGHRRPMADVEQQPRGEGLAPSLEDATLPATPKGVDSEVGDVSIGAWMRDFKEELAAPKRKIRETFVERLGQVAGWRGGPEECLNLAEDLTQEAAECGCRLAYTLKGSVIPVSLGYRDRVFVLMTDKGLVPGKESGYVTSSRELPRMTVLPRAPRASKRPGKNSINRPTEG